MHTFKGHKNIVNCIDVIGSDVFSGSWDSTVIQWSRATGQPVHVYRGHTDGVQCLQYYQDLVISGFDRVNTVQWTRHYEFGMSRYQTSHIDS